MKIYFVVMKKKTILIVAFMIITALIISLFFIYNNKKNKALEVTSQFDCAKLAIIIDDFGQSRDGVEEMLSINRHLTIAVMPFMEHSTEDATNANKCGYEVIVHLPLESTKGQLSWLGPRPILCNMSSEEIEKTVEDAFDNVPFAAGANIHMGSKACCDTNVVNSILNIIKNKTVYFVDSRTSSKSVIKELSNENNIKCYENNIFLDGQQPKSYVINQLKKAEKIAKEKGNAIAIGHVGIEGGKVTAQAIKEMLNEFDRENVQLVFVSELEN